MSENPSAQLCARNQEQMNPYKPGDEVTLSPIGQSRISMTRKQDRYAVRSVATEGVRLDGLGWVRVQDVQPAERDPAQPIEHWEGSYP